MALRRNADPSLRVAVIEDGRGARPRATVGPEGPAKKGDLVGTITVFGAAGKAGRRVVAEALSRGLEVRAVVRDPDAVDDLPDGATVVRGDVTDTDSVRELSEGTDVFIVTVGGPGREIWKRAATTVVETIRTLPGTHPRVIHMGGGASLTTPDGTRIMDLPDFPTAFLDPAVGQAAALDYYRTVDDVDWTFVSPPPVDFRPGTRHGHYRLGTDQPVTDDAGNASLTYEDFAAVLIDEVEHPAHPRQRITAGY